MNLSFAEETKNGEIFIVILASGVKKYLLKADTTQEHDKWIKKL